jgi:hypothetical protein
MSAIRRNRGKVIRKVRKGTVERVLKKRKKEGERKVTRCRDR